MHNLSSHEESFMSTQLGVKLLKLLKANFISIIFETKEITLKIQQKNLRREVKVESWDRLKPHPMDIQLINQYR